MFNLRAVLPPVLIKVGGRSGGRKSRKFKLGSRDQKDKQKALKEKHKGSQLSTPKQPLEKEGNNGREGSPFIGL